MPEHISDLSLAIGWLPLVFALVMPLAMLAYVILDGYDLGVGMLQRQADSDAQKESMIAMHRPFPECQRNLGGTGCERAAGWPIMKSEGALQHKAVAWAQNSLWFSAAGVSAISVATPLVSARIFDKWLSFPNLVLLLPIPAVPVALFVVMARSLKRLPLRLAQDNQYGAAVPFACTVGIFLLAFYGLGYSLFPGLVVDKLTIWQAASAPESLQIVFYGVAVVLPVIIGYTVVAYRVFWGKSTALQY